MPPKGLIVSLDAEPKSYKTSLLLSGPLPLVLVCYDPGWERAVFGVHGPELLKDVDFDPDKHVVYYEKPGRLDLAVGAWLNRPRGLTIIEVPMPIQPDNNKVEGVKEVFDYSQMIVGRLLRDPQIATICIDTATLLREFAADSFLQSDQRNNPTKQNLGQIEYGRPNGKVRTFYLNAKASGKNIMVTHHLHDEYVKRMVTDPRSGNTEEVSVTTGRRVPQGTVDRDKYIDVALNLENKGSVKEPKPTATFTLCGFNENLIGDTVENPTWNKIVARVQTSIADRRVWPRRV